MFKLREHRGEREEAGGWGQMVEVMYCAGAKKELMAAGDGETSRWKVMRFVYSVLVSGGGDMQHQLRSPRHQLESRLSSSDRRKDLLPLP